MTAPLPHDVALQRENPGHAEAVEALNRIAFGPGRFARTAFRIRESCRHAPDFSWIATRDGQMVGSVRMTTIHVGTTPAWLLGPLAVVPHMAGRGIGRALVAAAVAGVVGTGRDWIVLVGDLPYYRPVGFHRAPHDTIRWPGPVEAHRTLIRPVTDPPLTGDGETAPAAPSPPTGLVGPDPAGLSELGGGPPGAP